MSIARSPTAGSCCRSMRPISRWTAPSDSRTWPEAEFVASASSTWRRMNTAIEGIPRDTRPAACAAGAIGKARTCTTSRSRASCRCSTQANVGALSLEFANPRHQHEVRGAAPAPAARPTCADRRRDRHDDEFRRAPGGGGAAHRGGGPRRRRPRARHRQHRLRLRHLRGPGMGQPRTWSGPSSKAARSGADIASARLWGKDRQAAE